MVPVAEKLLRHPVFRGKIAEAISFERILRVGVVALAIVLLNSCLVIY